MQISSFGSADNLLTRKIYSTGSVSKHLIEESDSAKKLAEEKDKIDTEQKISGIVEASSKEALQVTNVDSLYAVNYNLKNMLSIAKYAAGDITDEDREKCEQEFNAYYNNIGAIDKSEQAALKKYYTDNPDATKTADSASADKTAVSGSGDSSGSDAAGILAAAKKSTAGKSNWYKNLGIDGVNVDTKEAATDAYGRCSKAIQTVKDEINKLTRTDESHDAQSEQKYPSQSDMAVNKKSKAEYVALLETNMQGDTKIASVTGDADASTAEDSSGSFYYTTGTALDIVG